MDAVSDAVIALDVGGTKALGGIVSPSGELVHVLQRPTGGKPGTVDPGLRIVHRLVQDLLHVARDRDLRVTAIGAGFPEYVSNGSLESHEVLDWDEQPQRMLQRLAPAAAPITIESDARCGALAEAAIGAGREHSQVAYVSWGTGLSWALVQDGTALTGRRGAAIGFGELGVSSRVAKEWDGNLEQFASGKGIATRYSDSGASSVDEAREVLARAAAGDPLAADILDSAARAMAEAIAWLVSLVDPDVVVLGGGIGVSGSSLRLDTERHYLNASSPLPDKPMLVSGSLGPHLGLLGAAIATGRVSV